MSTAIPTQTQHAKAAQASESLHAQHKADVWKLAKDLSVDVEAALNDMDVTINSLALKYSKTIGFIQEQLNLGGHVLKQQAPGINDPIAHCEVQCKRDDWVDLTKEVIRDIIEKVEDSRWHQDLTTAEKKVVINELLVYCAESTTGIVQRPMAQFYNTHVVMDHVLQKMSNLHSHNRIEFFLFVVKSDTKHYSKPVCMLTQWGKDFFATVLKLESTMLLKQFEAFSINGLCGVLHNHEMRKDNKKTIRETLHLQIKVLAEQEVWHLEFGHYEKQVVEHLGIIIEGWMCPDFLSPSDFKKISQVQDLYYAVNAGTCFSRKLSPTELEAHIASNKAHHE